VLSYRYSVFCLLAFGLTPIVVDAQITGGIGRVGGTGLRTPAGLRSGTGLRNSPVANPSPSLTPHQILNPRGSLSTGQVLNPRPSLFRPRSGDALSSPIVSPSRLDVTRGNSARPHSMSQSDQARSVDGDARGLTGDPQSSGTGDGRNSQLQPEGSQLLRLGPSELGITAKEREWGALVQLNAQLQRSIERFHHADTWKTYLDIAASDRDARMGQEPSSEDLRMIQSRFDRVAQIEKYQPLTGMAIFEQTRVQLSRYISQLGDDS
jgi:hypothetical protein